MKFVDVIKKELFYIYGSKRMVKRNEMGIFVEFVCDY